MGYTTTSMLYEMIDTNKAKTEDLEKLSKTMGLEVQEWFIGLQTIGEMIAEGDHVTEMIGHVINDIGCYGQDLTMTRDSIDDELKQRAKS